MKLKEKQLNILVNSLVLFTIVWTAMVAIHLYEENKSDNKISSDKQSLILFNQAASSLNELNNQADLIKNQLSNLSAILKSQTNLDKSNSK